MKPFAAIWLILLTCFLTPTVYASQFKIVFKESSPRLDSLATTLEKLIPESIKARLGQKTVFVHFTQFQKNPLKAVCVGDQESVSQIRGSSDLKSIGKTALKISISSDFRNYFENSEMTRFDYPCGHRNYTRLGLATILHEIIHLYDHTPYLSSQEQAQVQNCSNDMENQTACLQKLDFSRALSSRTEFKRLIWMAGHQTKNQLTSRAADPYELTDEEEALAVNFEYFILDPEYQCRRPSLFQFFSNRLGVQSKQINCVNSKIILDGMSDSHFPSRLINLDVSRIYQIDYLLADKGQDFSSGWRHSMLRIVMCSPERTTVSADCLQDIDFHLVASFRAAVNDLMVDNIKGLMGDYRSRLFIIPFQRIRQEYTKGELRDLIAYPLKLDRQEIIDFTNRILENYWEYNGSYKFLSNNCASETDQLLKVIIKNSSFQQKFIKTPIGLRDLLEATNLIEMNPSPQKYHIFRSEEQMIGRSLLALKSLGLPLNFKVGKSHVNHPIDYLKIAKTLKQMNLKPELMNKSLAQLRLVAEHDFFSLQLNLQEKLQEKLVEVQSKNKKIELKINDSEIVKIAELTQELKILAQDSPQAKVKPGTYGIALEADFLHQHQESRFNAGQSAEKLQVVLFEQENRRLRVIESFFDQFGEMLADF